MSIMKKNIITAFFCLITAISAQGQTVTLDSTLERYFVPIKDTVIYPDRPSANRLYCYTTTDLLYNACTIAWQLAYTEEGTTYTLTGGQVQMNGNYYAAYVADNRNIVHLFQYAGNYIGVIIK